MYRTLEYLRGISDDDVRRLRSRGIQHTNQLLHRTSLGIDRERLSKKTGITPERLLELFEGAHAEVTLKWQLAGHSLVPSDVRDAADWLALQRARV